MTIKSSATPNPPLSFQEIEAEFGAQSPRSLGHIAILKLLMVLLLMVLTQEFLHQVKLHLVIFMAKV